VVYGALNAVRDPAERQAQAKAKKSRRSARNSGNSSDLGR